MTWCRFNSFVMVEIYLHLIIHLIFSDCQIIKSTPSWDISRLYWSCDLYWTIDTLFISSLRKPYVRVYVGAVNSERIDAENWRRSKSNNKSNNKSNSPIDISINALRNKVTNQITEQAGTRGNYSNEFTLRGNYSNSTIFIWNTLINH